MMAKAKFSVSTGGIYPLAAYREFPSDALDIPDDFYKMFLDGSISGFSLENDKIVPMKMPVYQRDATLESISRLTQIDQETLRPLRAIYAGTDTQADHDKLAALETEAQQLRGELNAN